MGRVLAFAAALLLLSGPNASAAQITFDFNCTLGDNTTCSPSAIYGTLTLSDSPGNGDLLLTLDLVGSNDKFRDLLLNYSGSAARITSGDNQALLDVDEFVLTPYDGTFDVGDDDGQGWSFDGIGPYSTTLYGWTSSGSTDPANTAGVSNVNLLLADFSELDSLGQIYAALHIQAIGPRGCDATTNPPCPPGVQGDGSIKVGATLTPAPVPEPASLTLMGIGLGTSALWARRRRSSESARPQLPTTEVTE